MTLHQLFDRANDYQRERLLDLINSLRELRREIAEDHDILDPVHQPPRSSLHPRHFSGEGE